MPQPLSSLLLLLPTQWDNGSFSMQIVSVIIPFFDKHPILGVKSLDFFDIKKVAEIVQNKGHLTSSGFESIQKINSTLNLRRP